VPIELIERGAFEAWRSGLDSVSRAWVAANGFEGGDGKSLALPTAAGEIGRIAIGVSGPDDIFALSGAAASLQAGDYRIASPLGAENAGRMALGWGLGCYRFDRYRKTVKPQPRLAWPKAADRAQVELELDAITLVRDLVNTPANDMGPEALAEEAATLGATYGAQIAITVGDALIEANFPAVFAVGKAAEQAPRVVEITWGEPGLPEVALVGKGITFDTGGLDIKTGSGMGLMKKDMGGAAHALALGRMIMAAGLPVRLRILLAIAENAIGPNANRPSDIIRTRAGLSVEIGDTDAEGRLVLADMLTLAGESDPALIMDFATLTGAARVALGPDLPALFATDRLAADILNAAETAADPVWRMPLWKPYRRNLDSKIADINNIAGNSFAGAIHAALFLQEFVKPDAEWAHFDLYAWNATARPGRPAGGEAFAIRGLFRMLAARYAQ
jgi:leucyl aminopeptidase